MPETEDINTRLIVNEIRNLSSRISKLPTASDVRVAVMDGIQEHEDRCNARLNFGTVADRTAETTGIINTLKDTGTFRRSFIPAARALSLGKVPNWMWRLLGVIAIGVAGKFGIDGLGDVIPMAFGGQ